MANLGLSEDEKMVQDMMAKFARDELRPAAMDADTHESAPEAILNKGQSELALAIMSIPENLGGAWDGAPQDVQQVVRTMELSYGCAALAMALPGLGLAGPAVLELAGEAQAKKLVEPFCGEEPAWAALALTEADAGAELELFETVAEKTGEGWKVTGKKGPVANATRALGFVVVAKAPDGPRLLWVDAKAASVTVKATKWLGLRAAALGHVELAGAPAELLGEDDAAKHLAAAQSVLAHARLQAAAALSGVARAALDQAVAYSKDRVQFGEPIGQKQGLAFMMADMAMASEAARLLTLEAASRAEKKDKTFAAAAAEAFSHAAECADFVTENGVQVHGGYGFCREYPAEKWMRDAKTLALLIGTAADARETLAASLPFGKK